MSIIQKIEKKIINLQNYVNLSKPDKKLVNFVEALDLNLTFKEGLKSLPKNLELSFEDHLNPVIIISNDAYQGKNVLCMSSSNFNLLKEFTKLEHFATSKFLVDLTSMSFIKQNSKNIAKYKIKPEILKPAIFKHQLQKLQTTKTLKLNKGSLKLKLGLINESIPILIKRVEHLLNEIEQKSESTGIILYNIKLKRTMSKVLTINL